MNKNDLSMINMVLQDLTEWVRVVAVDIHMLSMISAICLVELAEVFLISLTVFLVVDSVAVLLVQEAAQDRKSTRLNSSHTS